MRGNLDSYCKNNNGVPRWANLTPKSYQPKTINFDDSLVSMKVAGTPVVPVGCRDGGELPKIHCTRRLHPKGVPISGRRYVKAVGILRAEIQKRVGKTVI